jgi:hypothetical protein
MSEYEPSGWELDLTTGIPNIVSFEIYYLWRIHHPDNLDADGYPPPIDGDDWGWDSSDEDLSGYFVGTPKDNCPPLSQYWQQRGWVIEAQGVRDRSS